MRPVAEDSRSPMETPTVLRSASTMPTAPATPAKPATTLKSRRAGRSPGMTHRPATAIPIASTMPT